MTFSSVSSSVLVSSFRQSVGWITWSSSACAAAACASALGNGVTARSTAGKLCACSVRTLVVTLDAAPWEAFMWQSAHPWPLGSAANSVPCHSSKVRSTCAPCRFWMSWQLPHIAPSSRRL